MGFWQRYIPHDELETIAEGLLTMYQSGHLLEAPRALDIEHFAEFALGANLDFAQLSDDLSVLGMTTFESTSLPLTNAEPTVDITIAPRTIVLDAKALESQPATRHRFTVAHECGHLILHEKYFLARSREDSSAVARCKTNTAAKTTKDQQDRLELQANYLGACLLMPRSTFTSYFNSHIAERWREMNDQDRKAAYTKLTETFQVSRVAAKLRIQDLDLRAE